MASNNESQAGGAETRIVFAAQAGVTYSIAFDTNWTPPPDQKAVGAQLAKTYHIKSPERLSECSICHR